MSHPGLLARIKHYSTFKIYLKTFKLEGYVYSKLRVWLNIVQTRIVMEMLGSFDQTLRGWYTL